MNKLGFLFSALFVLFLAAGARGQTIEPSYEVSLQLLIGSNDAQRKGEIPANLTSLSRQLKNSFAFSDYRLASTFLGRIANTGTFEYKSVTNIFGQEVPAASASFLEWNMQNFRNVAPAGGKPTFQAQMFRFGAKVPVTTGSSTDQSGKVSSMISWESIGLHVNRVSLPENVPTLIGTLNLPGAGGTIFLVMTVRSTDL